MLLVKNRCFNLQRSLDVGELARVHLETPGWVMEKQLIRQSNGIEFSGPACGALARHASIVAVALCLKNRSASRRFSHAVEATGNQQVHQAPPISAGKNYSVRAAVLPLCQGVRGLSPASAYSFSRLFNAHEIITQPKFL
jgi:hypothetical protein